MDFKKLLAEEKRARLQGTAPWRAEETTPDYARVREEANGGEEVDLSDYAVVDNEALPPIFVGEEELKPYRVGTVPSVYYIPNYLSKSEEDELLEEVRSSFLFLCVLKNLMIPRLV
jgi:hypothetical protein